MSKQSIGPFFSHKKELRMVSNLYKLMKLNSKHEGGKKRINNPIGTHTRFQRDISTNVPISPIY